jgi:hypothetical protein
VKRSILKSLCFAAFVPDLRQSNKHSLSSLSAFASSAYHFCSFCITAFLRFCITAFPSYFCIFATSSTCSFHNRGPVLAFLPLLSNSSSTNSIKMPVPSYGALPLSETFLCIRGLSLVAMVGIVGLTANFVAAINSVGIEPPREIVGTLSIVCVQAHCIFLIITNPDIDLHCNSVHSDQHSILHGSSKFGLVHHDSHR